MHAISRGDGPTPPLVVHAISRGDGPTPPLVEYKEDFYDCLDVWETLFSCEIICLFSLGRISG